MVLLDAAYHHFTVTHVFEAACWPFAFDHGAQRKLVEGHCHFPAGDGGGCEVNFDEEVDGACLIGVGDGGVGADYGLFG